MPRSGTAHSWSASLGEAAPTATACVAGRVALAPRSMNDAPPSDTRARAASSRSARPLPPSRGPRNAPGFESSIRTWSRDDRDAQHDLALVARERPVLHRVLGERQEQHRRDLDVGRADRARRRSTREERRDRGSRASRRARRRARAPSRAARSSRWMPVIIVRSIDESCTIARSATAPSSRHHSAIALSVLKRKCGSRWLRSARSCACSASRSSASARARSRRGAPRARCRARAPSRRPRRARRRPRGSASS